MNSTKLKAFLKHGVIPPICRGDLKSEVVAKIGEPDEWKGRIAGIGWDDPAITNFLDAEHWHYGSVCISFGADQDVEGMSVDYSEILKPIAILEAFGDLPWTQATLGELLDFMQRERVSYSHPTDSGICARTAGGVVISCAHGKCDNESPLSYLYYDSNDS